MATDPHADRSHDLVRIRERVGHVVLNPICSSVFHRISIHHPAHNLSRLIELSTSDEPNGGIHYATALQSAGLSLATSGTDGSQNIGTGIEYEWTEIPC